MMAVFYAAGELSRRGAVHFNDARVRVEAPHHAEKKHPAALEIVDEAAGAHEEAHVLLAGRRGTDHGKRV